MPDTLVGDLLCGTWRGSAAWHLVADGWPLLLVAIALLISLRGGWAVWRRRIWRGHAAQARWLEITPPVAATPAATTGLWRLLITVLPTPRRWTSRPARLVWEVVADPNGMRCGLWIPPGINPTAVMRLLHRGWPGVHTEQTAPPATPTAGAVATLAVWPTQPEWLPLVDNATSSARRGADASAPEEDRLRAVYGGLASAGRTSGGLLQVHLSRAPAHRLRSLRRAMTNPDRARRLRGTTRIAGLLADGLRALVIGALDLLTPSTAGRKQRSGPTDPYSSELARQARAKYADAPHLLVAVYAVAAGPTKAAAWAAAADITSGFGLLSAHFTRRRLHRGTVAATERWVPTTRMKLASVAEAAALAGLPSEPALYGLPGAASRRRIPSRDVFRTETRAPNQHTTVSDDGHDQPSVWRPS